MGSIYVAGIEWEENYRGQPVVNAADVLPLAPFTILFGANDSGKSSTLRAVAEKLDNISGRLDAGLFSTSVIGFRDDAPMLTALLADLQARGDTPSAAGDWALQTLADHPKLFSDSADGLAQMLAAAPVFALSAEVDEDGRPSGEDTWSVGLVISPPHAGEIPQALRNALEQVHGRRWALSLAIGPEVDPRLIGHPLRPRHLGTIGRTGLPLIPRPLSLPQGVDAALRALEDAVERARCAFRAWSESVGVAPAQESPQNPWVDVAGVADPFVAQLVGQLELLSHSLLPSFVRSSYRLDFDPSSPVRDPGVTRTNARLSAVIDLRRYPTFAEKFRVDEVASGFQLWIELAIWDLVAEADGATASLLLAACDEITGSLARPGAPARRFELLRRSLRSRELVDRPEWLCGSAERAWQLDMLATTPRDPRVLAALDAAERAARPRLVLIDEPERHLNAAVVKQAAGWLQRRARDVRGQVIIATHSPAFLSCHGEEVRHLHVQRVTNGLVYTTFTPSDQRALARVAQEMRLDHGELFGLTATIVWVEGPMDLAVLDALCGDELQRRGAYVATFGGLGNMRSILDSPLARLPGLSFVVVVDDLAEAQLQKVRADPGAVSRSEPDEMRQSARLIERASASGRELQLVSHGWPDIFFALPDDALAQLPRRAPWPGRDTVLRDAAEAGVPKSGLKGFVADRYGVKIEEASCRYAAELASQGALPEWVRELLAAVEAAAHA